MNEKKMILVVDDDEQVCELVKEYLTQNNYDCITAGNGTEALQAIGRDEPDLVLMDLLLPGEHGLDIIKLIKEEHSLPVIVISGIYNQNEISAYIKEQKIDGFYLKPLKLELLLKHINVILNE